MGNSSSGLDIKMRGRRRKSLINEKIQQALSVSNFQGTGRFARDRESSGYRKSYKMSSFQKI